MLILALTLVFLALTLAHFGADACFFVILRRDRRIGSGTYPRIIAPESEAWCRSGSSGRAGG